jgi:outer membrane protein OmpA-like peptidoglycan-associated protein
MKTLNTIALGMVIFISGAFSQVTAAIDNPSGSNYVVIGAFAVQRNAVKFTTSASEKNFTAKFELNPNRNLYYVYVLSTADRHQAIEEALRLRKESAYNDTWVYNGSLGENAESVQVEGTDINPETAQGIEEVRSSDVTSLAATASEMTTVSTEQAEVAVEEKTSSEPDTEVNGKSFYFKIFRADDNTQVEGDVNVIDAERSRKIGTYAGNKAVAVSNPNNKEGKISLVCDVFGFRKVQHDINYTSPEGEGIEVNGNAATIPFELVRLQKGDIAVMYNVYFFIDAAIMRPESRYEVNSLLAMLQENPKYKIKIHGHTNGNAHGKIISMGKDSKDFFSLSNTKDDFGSAKKLSGDRAEVIYSYLVSNGIDAQRMEVKAWGGKRAIYDKHGNQAQANVRVEIEILEN